MRAFFYGVGILLFFMAMAISYYVIFGVVIILIAFTLGKVGSIGYEEYKKAEYYEDN